MSIEELYNECLRLLRILHPKMDVTMVIGRDRSGMTVVNFGGQLARGNGLRGTLESVREMLVSCIREDLTMYYHELKSIMEPEDGLE